MRAWLIVCAALALAPCRATAAAAAHAPRPHRAHVPPVQYPPDPQRLERIKSQILAKLGLTSRPTPVGAPPRDVVRQILARADDPRLLPRPQDTDNEHAMREIIAIAQPKDEHDSFNSTAYQGSIGSTDHWMKILRLLKFFGPEYRWRCVLMH